VGGASHAGDTLKSKGENMVVFVFSLLALYVNERRNPMSSQGEKLLV
jgi:hypothetical protein